MDPSLDPLLQPFTLRGLSLRNRLVSTSHEPAYAEDGMPKERYRLYHVEKARGGIAMTMIGGSAIVAQDSPPAFGNLHLYKDEIVPWLSAMADQVHEAGAAIMCQVTHLGRRTSHFTADWLPVLAPSRVREAAHRSFPKVAEGWDLERIINRYAAGAQRCQAAHLDGIELMAYGHLLDGFWSPVTNQRDDEWGGDFESRMRFPIAVVRAVRAAVGPHFIVGIRMAVDEQLPGGVDEEQGLRILSRLVAEGIDFVSVIQGHIDSDLGLSQVIPGMGTPLAPFLPLASRARRQVGIPVMQAGRIMDVATARHAISEGMVDLVGMTRAHLADPYIATKLVAGVEERIRPCVGASHCLETMDRGEGALCIHNPSTGREANLPHTVPARRGPARRAVVVGAGPAGLEAARVLGERGHDVTLFEAADEAGGQLRLASRRDRRRELMGIIHWRVAECERLGVKATYGRLADCTMVLGEEPDLVIVATGGQPDTDILRYGGELVTDTWEVLSRASHPAGTVLVYDDNGAYPALDAAEWLTKFGARVEYVTPERIFAPEVGGINHPPYLKAFADASIGITLNSRLVGVERRDSALIACLQNEYNGASTERRVDRVVVEHGAAPNDELYYGLLPYSTNLGEVDYEALLESREQSVVTNPSGRFQLFRVGDAVAGRNVHAAVLDAFRICVRS